MSDDAEAAWWLPGRHGQPAEVLPRVQAICATVADLPACMLLLMATHQGLPRDILAAVTQQFRTDLADLSREDVVGLYTALQNGGRQGFDAVLRSRRKGERKANNFGSWIKD